MTKLPIFFVLQMILQKEFAHEFKKLLIISGKQLPVFRIFFYICPKFIEKIHEDS